MPAVASHRLDTHECEKHHPQQHEAVPEPGDLGLPVGATGVADGDLDRLEAELRDAEDELEIPEWIEIPEIAAAGLEPRIIRTAHGFGSAQSIGEALREQPSEQQGENFVGDKMENPNRLHLQRVDQPRAVDEFALAGPDRVPEFRHL